MGAENRWDSTGRVMVISPLRATYADTFLRGDPGPPDGHVRGSIYLCPATTGRRLPLVAGPLTYDVRCVAGRIAFVTTYLVQSG